MKALSVQPGAAPVSAERWADVPGAPGYEVSDQGRVRRGHRCLSSSPRGAKNPYLSVHVAGASRYVHRLVLEAFVGPSPEGSEAAHLDGDPSNPRLSNLAWVSPTENAAHRVLHGTNNHGARNGRAKLSASQVREMRESYSAGASQRELADRFGVSRSRVSTVLRGEGWSRVAVGPLARKLTLVEAQRRGAEAKHRRTMEELLPAVVSAIREVIDAGDRPTLRRCRALPGFHTVVKHVRLSELVRRAQEQACAA